MKLKYAVVFEQTPNNYAAYAPDVPGCISTGKTWDEMQEMIREALTFHIEFLIEEGDPVPEPKMLHRGGHRPPQRSPRRMCKGDSLRVRRPGSHDLDHVPNGRNRGRSPTGGEGELMPGGAAWATAVLMGESQMTIVIEG